MRAATRSARHFITTSAAILKSTVQRFSGSASATSPRWSTPAASRPRGYDVFEPYYTEAGRLFHVHGQRGEDPLEPWSSAPYAHPPVSHEPKIAELANNLRRIGLNPFHLPLGILLDENDGKPTPTSTCMRCSFFDGFPCLLNGKADAQVICIDPMLSKYSNVTLLTGAYASKLGTDRSGRTVNAVHVMREGHEELYSADVVVVACGALS